MMLNNSNLGPASLYKIEDLGEQIITEISDVRTVPVSANTNVGYTLLNRHLIGEKSAIVAIGGFMSDLTTPDRAYEGIQLSTLERPVLMLDLPGHGLSTPHSKQQIVDLCFHRDANTQAAPLTAAVGKILGRNDPIDLFGVSHGSLMSLFIANQDPGHRVANVFGVDLPAVRRRSTIGLQAGYILFDGLIGRRKYLSCLEDTPHELDFNNFKDRFAELHVAPAKKFTEQDKRLFLINLFFSVNARPVALSTWRELMHNTTTKVEVATGSESNVSDHRAIAEFISSLPLDKKRRSRQVVLPGEDHNIGIVHLMPRAVDWAQAAYTRTA